MKIKCKINGQEVSAKAFISKLNICATIQAFTDFDKWFDDQQGVVRLAGLTFKPSEIIRKCNYKEYKRLREEYCQNLAVESQELLSECEAVTLDNTMFELEPEEERK